MKKQQNHWAWIEDTITKGVVYNIDQNLSAFNPFGKVEWYMTDPHALASTKTEALLHKEEMTKYKVVLV